MHFLCILSALLLIASPSFAMVKREAKKSVPPPTPVCCFDTRWSGFTIGLTAGGLVNASSGAIHPAGEFLSAANIADNPQRNDAFDMHGGAFICGAQIGGNYQMKSIVLGAETDFNYSTLSRSHSTTKTLTSPLSGTWTDNVSQLFNWFGTIRPRVGIAIRPVLIYATGGFAYGHISSHTNVSASANNDRYGGSSADWKIGWTLGGGLEWAFSQHWSMKGEYLFIDLQKQRYNAPNISPSAFQSFAYKTSLETEAHIIRLGFNFTL